MKIRIYYSFILLITIACSNEKEFKELSIENQYEIIANSFKYKDNKSEKEKVQALNELINYENFNNSIGWNPADISKLLRYEINKVKVDTVDVPGKSVPAIPRSGSIKRCATFDPSGKEAIKAFVQQEMYVAKLNHQLDQIRYKIPLKIHFVNGRFNNSNRDKKIIRKQIELLNEAFDPINISFYPSAIITHTITKWDRVFFDYYNQNTYTEAQKLCDSLGDRSDRSIHIYINDLPLLGQANFPWSDSYRTDYDCIFLSHESLPGGYYKGKTLIHEMGHFFGLFHTFHDPRNSDSCDSPNNNGCKGAGDRVADTPPQKLCRFGSGFCEDGTGNECDSINGTDLVENSPCNNGKPCVSCNPNQYETATNFMGYNSDDVLSEFTPGQYNRMEMYFQIERSGWAENIN